MKQWLSRVSPTGAVVALALVVFGGAVTFYAAAQRYQTTHLMGLWVARTDRLTGRIEFCFASQACRPAPPKYSAGNPFAAKP